MAFSDLASNQMVSFTDVQSGGFSLNSGQSNVTSNQCMTKSEALAKYNLDSSYMSSYASNQLLPKSTFVSASLGYYAYEVRGRYYSSTRAWGATDTPFTLYSADPVLVIGSTVYNNTALTSQYQGTSNGLWLKNNTGGKSIRLGVGTNVVNRILDNDTRTFADVNVPFGTDLYSQVTCDNTGYKASGNLDIIIEYQLSDGSWQLASRITSANIGTDPSDIIEDTNFYTVEVPIQSAIRAMPTLTISKQFSYQCVAFTASVEKYSQAGTNIYGRFNFTAGNVNAFFFDFTDVLTELEAGDELFFSYAMETTTTNAIDTP